MKTISYIKKLQDKVNNANKELSNIESKVNSNNTIINKIINKINNINVPLSSLPNKTDAQAIQDKINQLVEIKTIGVNPNEQITATCGDKSIQTQADSTGTGYLNPTKYGDWSVNGKLLSVTSAKQYELSFLPAPKIPLSAMSWSNIAKVSESGKASEYWNIGDEKDITLTTGETLTFQIYDFNHDDLADGSGKAGITFGMKNLMATGRRINSDDFYRNGKSYKEFGGFINTEMYKWLNGECFNSLPSDLKSLIKPVNKQTSTGDYNQPSTTIRTDTMKLWLFSEKEVFNTTDNSYDGEGYQYPYFIIFKGYTRKGISKLDSNFNPNYPYSYWWLRSYYYGDLFDYVSADGYYSGPHVCTDDKYKVCFGFCI